MSFSVLMVYFNGSQHLICVFHNDDESLL